MFVSEKYSGKCPVSFEIFPPKGEFDIDGVRTLINDLKVLSPDFISVTYSAGGGGNSKKQLTSRQSSKMNSALTLYAT